MPVVIPGYSGSSCGLDANNPCTFAVVSGVITPENVGQTPGGEHAATVLPRFGDACQPPRRRGDWSRAGSSRQQERARTGDIRPGALSRRSLAKAEGRRTNPVMPVGINRAHRVESPDDIGAPIGFGSGPEFVERPELASGEHAESVELAGSNSLNFNFRLKLATKSPRLTPNTAYTPE